MIYTSAFLPCALMSSARVRVQRRSVLHQFQACIPKCGIYMKQKANIMQCMEILRIIDKTHSTIWTKPNKNLGLSAMNDEDA